MKKLNASCVAMAMKCQPTCEAFSTQGYSHYSVVNVNVKW